MKFSILYLFLFVEIVLSQSNGLITNRRDKLYGEITSDGIIYTGGFDLPKGFVGSGTSDFAFNGPSFRYFKPSANIIENKNNFKTDDVIRDWYWPDEFEDMKQKFKQIETTTTTESQPNVSENNIAVYLPHYPNPCQINCHKMVLTSEYNPVCGSDGVTYYNPGKFRCAQACGRKITGRFHTSCGLGSPKM